MIVHAQTATMAIVAAMGRAYAKAATRFEKIAHLCVVEAGAPLLPGGEARSNLGALIQRFDSRLAAAAIVYEEEGFRATAVRSIVTGLCMAARTTHPTRVFSDLDAGCQWTSSLLPQAHQLTAEQLLAAVHELRRRQSEPSAQTSPRSSRS